VNKQEYLLAYLGGECGEVSQVVGNIMRFGASNYPEKYDGVPDVELLKTKIHDVIAVYQTYMRGEGLSDEIDQNYLDAKQTKVLTYVLNRKC